MTRNASHPDTAPTATLTLAGATRVLDAAMAAAADHGVAVCISVCDPGGHTVLTARMDGAPLLSQRIADDKAYTVIAFQGLPTSAWWGAIEHEPALVHGITKTPRLIVFGGGAPVHADGHLVGAVGISGGSAEQDAAIAEAAAAAVR